MSPLFLFVSALPAVLGNGDVLNVDNQSCHDKKNNCAKEKCTFHHGGRFQLLGKVRRVL